jgi:YVTN family beta-propeller protein
VGQAPTALAVTPDGGTVYSVGGDSDTVTAMTTAAGEGNAGRRGTGRRGTARAGVRIPVGYSPAAIAVSPASGTAYVVNTISGTLTPVSTRTNHARRPIGVGIFTYPTAIALAGRIGVVIGTYAGRVTLINTRTRQVTARLRVGSYPVAVAIAR